MASVEVFHPFVEELRDEEEGWDAEDEEREDDDQSSKPSSKTARDSTEDFMYGATYGTDILAVLRIVAGLLITFCVLGACAAILKSGEGHQCVAMVPIFKGGKHGRFTLLSVLGNSFGWLISKTNVLVFSIAVMDFLEVTNHSKLIDYSYVAFSHYILFVFTLKQVLKLAQAIHPDIGYFQISWPVWAFGAISSFFLFKTNSKRRYPHLYTLSVLIFFFLLVEEYASIGLWSFVMMYCTLTITRKYYENDCSFGRLIIETAHSVCDSLEVVGDHVRNIICSSPDLEIRLTVYERLQLITLTSYLIIAIIHWYM